MVMSILNRLFDGEQSKQTNLKYVNAIVHQTNLISILLYVLDRILFLPIPNTSAHAKNQLSMSKGKGCRRGTDRQTDRQTNIPRTDQRLKTYEIFFSIFNFICSSAV